MSSHEDIRTLVAREIELITDPARQGAIRSCLVEPVQSFRQWNYGSPEERYPCWTVAVAPQHGLEFVYCGFGFGPEFPWGCLLLNQGDLGNDGQWYWYLEEAYVQAGLWAPQVSSLEAFWLPPNERFKK